MESFSEKFMKILHIIDSLGLGGAQTLIKELLENQSSNDFIYLYSLRNKKKSFWIKHKNVLINSSQGKYSISGFFELVSIIRKNEIKVLHCHLFKSQFFGWILKLIFFPNIVLIQHEHGNIFKKSFSYRSFIRISSFKTDLFMAISKETRRKLTLEAKVPKNKIRLLYNFVNLDKFNRKRISWNIDKERAKIGIKKEDFVVGFTSRLTPRKGWVEFVEAAEILVEKNKNFKFIVASAGRDEDKFLELVDRYGLGNNFIYLGFVLDVVRPYSLMNSLAVPSHWEPMGLVEIEAQAMGIPVVVSDVPGLNEVVKDGINSLFFEAKNSKDLSNKIYELYSNQIFKNKLISNGYKNVKQFEVGKYIKNLGRIYEDLYKI